MNYAPRPSPSNTIRSEIQSVRFFFGGSSISQGYAACHFMRRHTGTTRDTYVPSWRRVLLSLSTQSWLGTRSTSVGYAGGQRNRRKTFATPSHYSHLHLPANLRGLLSIYIRRF